MSRAKYITYHNSTISALEPGSLDMYRLSALCPPRRDVRVRPASRRSRSTWRPGQQRIGVEYGHVLPLEQHTRTRSQCPVAGQRCCDDNGEYGEREGCQW